MRILSRRPLKEFWTRHPRAREPLEAWYAIAEAAEWRSAHDVRLSFPAGVDFVGDNRIIFDIRHNEYRLIAHVAYPFGRMLIKFVGAHREYDRIDPETV